MKKSDHLAALEREEEQVRRRSVEARHVLEEVQQEHARLRLEADRASTPPLVDVIAEVLAGHNYAFLTVPHNRPGTEIACAGCGISEGNPTLTKAEWFAAHQARAVLDALTKAGGVEWGVRYSDSQYTARHASQESAQDTAAEHNAIDKSEWRQAFDMEVVTRITTPWTAAR